ncbi:hypothetical protein BBJ28_00013298 [Nothophytophthora sp. Chile5]|nr:hypothetical protein BBJ28_00013298 [Nothophytophthora sp. Chile5]
MAINANGDLYTVGHNDQGQLGHGATSAKIVEKSRQVALEGERVATAASNRDHSAIVTESGALYVCGRNDSGQLGTDDMANKFRFHLVKGFSSRPVLATAVESFNGYFVATCDTEGGGVMAFGNNEHGQLGIGRVTEPILEPTSCGANVIVVQLACGDSYTAALTASGDVYTFGNNKYGQLGLGRADESDVTKPTVRRQPSHIVQGALL